MIVWTLHRPSTRAGGNFTLRISRVDGGGRRDMGRLVVTSLACAKALVPVGSREFTIRGGRKWLQAVAMWAPGREGRA